MKPDNLGFLRCPSCKGPLQFSGQSVAPGVPSTASCSHCEKTFSGSNGYLDFLGYPDLADSSGRERAIRSFLAKIYTPITDFMFLFCGGPRSARWQVLDHLELRDNARVLETGVGPGDNYPFLAKRAKNLQFFGIDYQNQMLVQCIRNSQKWKFDSEVYRADAEELPFQDEMFDVVLQLGAFNLFPDKKKAIDEMIRVAKPGTRIVIADESEKVEKIFNFFTGRDDKVVPPIDLVPSHMEHIRLDTIWNGLGYVVAFTKP